MAFFSKKIITDKKIAAKLKKAIKTKLLCHGSPRLQMALILFFTSAVAFMVSTLLLKVFHIQMMWLRYTMAALAAYLFFFLALRIWMIYIRSQEKTKIIMEEIISEADGELRNYLEGRIVNGMESLSGDNSDSQISGSGEGSSGISLDLDGDAVKGVLILILIAVALSLLIVFGYIIFAAPALLSEMALDAAVVGAFYKRVHKIQGSNWLIGALRGTWIPFLIVVFILAITGFIIQRINPEFASLGDVVRFILS